MSIEQQIEEAVKGAIEDATVEVRGSGGHFEIKVVSTVFDGMKMLEKQRTVLRSIKHLMAGDNAPVHAIDKLETITP